MPTLQESWPMLDSKNWHDLSSDDDPVLAVRAPSHWSYTLRTSMETTNLSELLSRTVGCSGEGVAGVSGSGYVVSAQKRKDLCW